MKCATQTEHGEFSQNSMQSYMWSHRQHTVHFTIRCSISLLLCHEVQVIHEQDWGTALWTNSHQMGKEDWHWSRQNRCPRNYILYFTHFWHKLGNKCDCSIASLYNISGWSFFLGWLCSTEPISGSHTLSCQTVTVLALCMPGRRAHFCLHEVTMNKSVVLNSLTFSVSSSAAIHSGKEQKLWFTVDYLLGYTAWG